MRDKAFLRVTVLMVMLSLVVAALFVWDWLKSH